MKTDKILQLALIKAYSKDGMDRADELNTVIG